MDEGQQVDAQLLREALSQPAVQAWSEVTAGSGERFGGLPLWLALALQGRCLLTAQRAAVERGIVAHAWPLGRGVGLCVEEDRPVKRALEDVGE